ncbi:hypothetical protein VTN00DRAFT_5496 [Thermoascus crustaceus]|uniref:uncharacterized protein n=1 Tax=Thermoascus crustaceus TaxID=5088 RepID=UPI0037445785
MWHVAKVDHHHHHHHPNRDLDGYIDVLRRKIAAGYLVEAHQKMLDKLLAIKAEIPPIDKDEPKGLPKEVYQLLFSLKAIRADNPDDAPQNKNIDAIIQAYRSGTLQIESGKVSYWVTGVQISGLKDRDLDDILTVGMEHNADKKEFWVEALVEGGNLVAGSGKGLHGNHTEYTTESYLLAPPSPLFKPSGYLQ